MPAKAAARQAMEAPRKPEKIRAKATAKPRARARRRTQPPNRSRPRANRNQRKKNKPAAGCPATGSEACKSCDLRALLLRDLRSFLPRFRKSDRDCLLAVLHRMLSVAHMMHLCADFLARFRTILAPA